MFPYLIAGAIGFVVAKLFDEDEAPKYDDGGSVLLAPNGKPSNLTPEQYELVRSSAFKKWFGDWENDPANASKVVDENGEPKVVTHSTSNEDSEGNKYNYPPFNIFDGNRIFNTPNSSVIPIWFSYKGNYVVHKTIVNMPFFLNIKNLFLFNNEKHLKKLQDYMIEKYNNYDVDLEYDYNNNWEAIENENLPAYISEIGFDGYKTDSESAIAIFKSEQGKLADGTNTTFDGNNPDIRFDGGGDVDYIANDYLKKKYNHIKKENATFEDLPEIYVRVGKPRMRSGKYFPSKNYVSNTKELGISVFTARYSPNSGFVFIDLNDAKGYEEESGYNIDSTYENFESENVEIYLVEGEVIKGKPSFMQLYSGEIKDVTEPYSRGGDGDRLLSVENFKIIGKLNPDKIVANIEYYKEYKYQDNPNTFSGKKLKKYPKYTDGGSVNVIDVKQYNVGKRNYRFVEIAEKKYNKIELYRQSDDGNYYGNLLYRRVPRYNAEFSSPMVNDINQLYAYEPVSNEELFNAVKNKTKPFASFGYWLSYYTEEEIQKEIQSFIDECDKYDLEYAVEKISGENKSLERIQFQVCQKGTFDELFDINALIEDYANNDFDSYDIEELEEFRYVELSYFLYNEWDDNYALTGLILGIPPKFTMALLNMGTSYGLAKDYKYDNEVIIM